MDERPRSCLSEYDSLKYGICGKIDRKLLIYLLKRENYKMAKLGIWEATEAKIL